jgi:peptidyl-prolyl cis-trans isomerase B (cyclophilin B)
VAQNRKHYEAQTARQREAHRRAQAAREEAARAAAAARKAKQLRYGLIAGLLSLALIGTLVWYGFRNHGVEAPTATQSPEVTQPTAQDNMPGVPDPAIAEGRTWTAVLHTSQGDITIELDGAAAPQAVSNFIYLARDGFFDDTFCHRLTTWGVLQCGDPTGTGGGGPEWRFGPIENAPADDFYPTGTVAMARVGNQAFSMGSQFFLVFEGTPIPSDAAGGYTVLGRITSGLDIVQAVAAAGVAGGGTDGRPATDVTIEGVSVQ